MTVCHKATAAMARQLRSEDEQERLDDFRVLSGEARNAQKARDAWMQKARAEVERR